MDRSDAYGQPAPQQQEPVLQQRPQAGQPSMNRPAYGLPGEITLRPGTYMTVRIGQPLSSDRNQPGDTFVASLAQPVVVDGIVVAQRNQMVYGRVAEAERSHADRPSRLALELTSLTLADGTQVPIRSQLVGAAGRVDPGRPAGRHGCDDDRRRRGDRRQSRVREPARRSARVSAQSPESRAC